jgi:hypothetical protein
MQRSRTNVAPRKKQFDQTVGIHPSAAEEFATIREIAVRPKMAAEQEAARRRVSGGIAAAPRVSQ